VEAVFEGSAAAVNAMIDWCRSGPSRAEVTEIEMVDEPATGDRGFVVR
jgi:acylphosphatase